MKPNGKPAFRISIFALCALSLIPALASAESLRGNFKITSETHWGGLLLSPGEYEFTMSRDVSAFLVTVRSRDTGWSGMVLAEAASDARPGGETRLVLVNSRGALFVRRLCLPESGVALDYPIATAGKLVYLARTPPSGIAVASASSGR